MLEVPQKAGKFKVTFNTPCSPPLKALCPERITRTTLSNKDQTKRMTVRNLRAATPENAE
jgi:hypothetical protein